MSAKTVKLSLPRKYRTWCDECQDGYQGGKPSVTKWQDRHNLERHDTPLP